jgi:hypothetical protein
MWLSPRSVPAGTVRNGLSSRRCRAVPEPAGSAVKLVSSGFGAKTRLRGYVATLSSIDFA